MPREYIRTIKTKILVKKLSLPLIFTAICVGGVIGISFKFIMLLNHWLYFPFFPNIFDAMFLIISVLYLSYNSVKYIQIREEK